MARVVISGYMIRYPMAGSQLAYFHYLLGYSLLGHDVVYVEESGWHEACYDPTSDTQSSDPRRGLRSARELCSAYELDCPLIYVDRESGRTFGATRRDLESHLASADVWLNIGGVCALPEFELCKRRVLIDMDPFFTQIGKFAGGQLDFYHAHFTYGTNIGRDSCSIPTRDIDWHALFPPVVAEIWTDHRRRNDSGNVQAALTTIANWTAYGSVEWRGQSYGQKDTEFLQVKSLPQLTSQNFVLALAGATRQIRKEFRSFGWSIVSGAEISTDRRQYQRFIQDSVGEFSVAKQAYVATRSGWFSDRTVCYLAAGLPVVVQDTGIGESLRVGEGVLVFSSLDEAVAAVESLRANYAKQCRWAEELAQDEFSYRAILPRVLDIAARIDQPDKPAA